jgi:hypothetical protein
MEYGQMRHFSLLIRNSPGLSAVSASRLGAGPVGRLRRRLDDLLADIFARAVATNDLEGAADLLAILENWHRRRKAHYGRGRRVDGADLKTMRANLDRLTAQRKS